MKTTYLIINVKTGNTIDAADCMHDCLAKLAYWQPVFGMVAFRKEVKWL
jgi:hypothetical protein